MLRGLIAGLDRELDMLLNDEYAAITREEEVKNEKCFSNFTSIVNIIFRNH